MPVIDINQLPSGERLPGWKDHSFNTGMMTFAHFAFAAGATIHEHCHSNEEVWTVIEGELQVSIGGDSIVAGPGCVAVVPPNTAHSVKAITDGKAIVTDCPVRIDPSGGRRGVIRVDFDASFALPSPASANPIRFTVRNIGKGRAVVKGIDVEARVASMLPPPTATQVAGNEMPTLGTLDAGELRVENVDLALDASQHDQIVSGAGVLYLRGVVVYDDDFGSRWHRTFCAVYDRAAGGFTAPDKPGYNYGS